MREMIQIESDDSLGLGGCGWFSGGRWVVDRFENVKLEFNYFGVVHCSHTLEHMASPMATLKKIWDTMTMGGLLFVEVPNIEIIKRWDFIEEFFIDKHLFHFSYPALAKYLHKANFEILEANVTQENVSIVAKKVGYPTSTIEGMFAKLSFKYEFVSVLFNS